MDDRRRQSNLDRTLSLQELVDQLDRANPVRSGDEKTTLRNQVQHWANKGLLDAILPPNERHVGRGRVRRYTEMTVYWCALLQVMAARGMPVARMAQVGRTVEQYRRQVQNVPDGDKADLIEEAIAGKGSNVFLVMCSLGRSGNDFDEPNRGLYNVTREPIQIPDEARDAYILNLSRIFAGVRR